MKHDMQAVLHYLKNYDGPEIKLMEVCGTHTASIFRNGIRSLLSKNIKLISGPGCPVCVTPGGYIDKLIALSLLPNHAVLTFGDMMSVPGKNGSLAEAKANGARVELLYSPLEAITRAKNEPETTFIMAAIGFETTVPSYALLLRDLSHMNIQNVKLLTSLKTIVPALHWVCQTEKSIDGFICPGHVSIVTGDSIYREMAALYQKPFVIAGFEAEHLLATIYDLVIHIVQKKPVVHNLYPNVVKNNGNEKAAAIINTFFETDHAIWRALGSIDSSGFYIRNEYSAYDAGSRDISHHENDAPGCQCSNVIIGRITPNECPLFRVVCTPQKPVGPCMVSSEGACGIWNKEWRQS